MLVYYVGQLSVHRSRTLKLTLQINTNIWPKPLNNKKEKEKKEYWAKPQGQSSHYIICLKNCKYLYRNINGKAHIVSSDAIEHKHEYPNL